MVVGGLFLTPRTHAEGRRALPGLELGQFHEPVPNRSLEITASTAWPLRSVGVLRGGGVSAWPSGNEFNLLGVGQLASPARKSARRSFAAMLLELEKA